jgi:hypothetical protein
MLTTNDPLGYAAPGRMVGYGELLSWYHAPAPFRGGPMQRDSASKNDAHYSACYRCCDSDPAKAEDGWSRVEAPVLIVPP